MAEKKNMIEVEAIYQQDTENFHKYEIPKQPEGIIISINPRSSSGKAYHSKDMKMPNQLIINFVPGIGAKSKK